MQHLTTHLIIIVNIIGVLSISYCPLNETEWKSRSETKVCYGKHVYHCLLFEDGKSRKEKCLERTLVIGGNCPIITHEDYLHWMTCNETGCPSIPFRSDEVYKYPVCFGDIENKGKTSLENQNLSENNNLSMKIGVPLGIVAVLILVTVFLVFKKRRQMNCISGFLRNNDAVTDPESMQLMKKPENITIGIEQLEAKNILYIIGQLGNSVSTTGKKITEEYAEPRKMSVQCFNYLNVSKIFSELSTENVFKPGYVIFIDGWAGLWNENPCERRETLDILDKVVKHSQSVENIKFVIGLRTEIHEKLKDELVRLDICISEHERLSLDYSTIYKRKKVVEEIDLLQNSCSDVGCGCKSLTFEKVSEINQVPIGTYLVVKLMSLDHKMIPDFIEKDKGPLKAVRNIFEGFMEGDQTWPWLPYFVCIGYYDKKEFRQEIIHEFDISEDMMSDPDNIAKYTKLLNKNKLAPMWSERFNLVKSKEVGSRKVRVFWHNFLYICAFHACFKKYPKQMLQFCNLDAVLQLVRPKSHPNSLAITATDDEVDFFCKERLKNLADDDVFSEHPLVIDWKSRTEE